MLTFAANITYVMKRLFQTLFFVLIAITATAQLSTNKDKFLGNITTEYQVDYGNEAFYTLWNQITPENESKWDQVQGNRSQFNWGNVDRIYNYAKQHNFPFKFHTFVWGSQFPGWLKNLSASERFEAIKNWMDKAKERYPNLEMIDVVNEAVEGHQADTHYISEALGGPGVTGYDWIIKAFEMAYERWPNAILIYNDFNTFQWNTDQFIDLVRTLRDAGAPIDAYGCQSHDLTDCSESNFKNAMEKIQSALKMPMYSTEYDIGTNDDDLQLQRYKEQIPYMWESDYCAGITLWGYIYGKTWTGKESEGTKGNSGIIRNGQDRPAMKWLREYMASETAKTAKSPFPGMKKEASVYVKPASLHATVDEPLSIAINAKLRTKTIESVKLYVNDQLHATLTEAPYTTSYTPTKSGRYNLKAVIKATDGSEYERLSRFTATLPRKPFKTIELPGTLEVEDFDMGGEGVSFHDSDETNSGTSAYRSDGEGVDLVGVSGGYALGYTNTNEWLEYTVNVKQAGRYRFEAVVSSGVDNSSFSLSLNTGNGLQDLTGTISVPSAGQNDWNTYSTVEGNLLLPLSVGKQIIRLNITGSSCNIDKIKFTAIPSVPRKPFHDVAIELPGTLEVEDFDRGEEGVAFHDVDSKNEGSSDYRQDGEGVDIVGASSGYGIGYTATGEWLEYTVNVTEAGTYCYEALVASGLDGSSFSLSLNTGNGLKDLTGTVTVPNTGSWNTYSTVSGKLLIPLEEGQQIIRLAITGGYCNLDKIKFKSLKGDISNDGDVDEQDVAALSDLVMGGGTSDEDIDLGHTPYCDMELPGTIEAENFDRGGEGVGYHDSDDTNSEGDVGYRDDNGAVEINHGAPNGGFAIGYTAPNEWYEYTIDVKKDGIYSFEAIVSSGYANSSFSLSLHTKDGLTALTDAVPVTSAGENNWNTYTTSKGRLLVPLQKGRQVIRLTISDDGYCNIDKIRFTHVDGTSKGDMNKDGVVDIVDIAKLIEMILNQK